MYMRLGQVIKTSVSWFAPARLIVRGPRKGGNSIAITFDDGPDAQNTEHILDTLSATETRATFFLIGDKASSLPGLVRQIHDRGHQIANHGFAHLNARRHPVQQIIKDIEQAQAALEDIVGVSLARDFRPPYGAITPQSFVAVAKLGYRFVFWSIDSLDHEARNANEVNTNIKGRSRAGDILLFHEDYSHTATALPLILNEIMGRGLKSVTVDAFR